MDMYEAEMLAAAALHEKEPAATFNKRPLSERKPADTGSRTLMTVLVDDCNIFNIIYP